MVARDPEPALEINRNPDLNESRLLNPDPYLSR